MNIKHGTKKTEGDIKMKNIISKILDIIALGIRTVTLIIVVFGSLILAIPYILSLFGLVYYTKVYIFILPISLIIWAFLRNKNEDNKYN